MKFRPKTEIFRVQKLGENKQDAIEICPNTNRKKSRNVFIKDECCLVNLLVDKSYNMMCISNSMIGMTRSRIF